MLIRGRVRTRANAAAEGRIHLYVRLRPLITSISLTSAGNFADNNLKIASRASHVYTNSTKPIWETEAGKLTIRQTGLARGRQEQFTVRERPGYAKAKNITEDQGSHQSAQAPGGLARYLAAPG